MLIGDDGFELFKLFHDFSLSVNFISPLTNNGCSFDDDLLPTFRVFVNHLTKLFFVVFSKTGALDVFNGFC